MSTAKKSGAKKLIIAHFKAVSTINRANVHTKSNGGYILLALAIQIILQFRRNLLSYAWTIDCIASPRHSDLRKYMLKKITG